MGWLKAITDTGRNSKVYTLHILSRIAFLSTVLAIFVITTPLAQALETQLASVYPIVGTRISSKFGMRNHPIVNRRRHHHGIDLAAPEDALVRAIQPGTVIFADRRGGYGNLVVILHDTGLTSHYGHLNKIKAKIGVRVKAGELIGLVGSTGKVTGPHLHLEIRKNGKPLDPLKLFPNIAERGEG